MHHVDISRGPRHLGRLTLPSRRAAADLKRKLETDNREFQESANPRYELIPCAVPAPITGYCEFLGMTDPNGRGLNAIIARLDALEASGETKAE